MEYFKNWPYRILIDAKRARDMPEYFILTYGDVELEIGEPPILTKTELAAVKTPVVLHAAKQYILGLN